MTVLGLSRGFIGKKRILRCEVGEGACNEVDKKPAA